MGRCVGGWTYLDLLVKIGSLEIRQTLQVTVLQLGKESGVIHRLGEVDSHNLHLYRESRWVGGWVGGWVDEKVEEIEAVGMSYWTW